MNRIASDGESLEGGILRARALLFDMDGTLIDSGGNVHRAYRWWAARHGLPVEPILAVESGRPHHEVMVQFAPTLDADEESRLFAEYEEQDETYTPVIAGAEEALRTAQKGRWAVVTSAKRTLAEMRFRITGLPLPSVLITSDVVQRGKPDPECFLRAADALAVAPSECLVFEDAPAGVEGARRAGMAVIGVGRTARLPEDIPTIRDFREIAIRYESDGWFSLRRVQG